MADQSLCDDVYLNYIIVYFRRTQWLISQFVMELISSGCMKGILMRRMIQTGGLTCDQSILRHARQLKNTKCMFMA